MFHIIKRSIAKLIPIYKLNERYAFSSSFWGVFFNPFYFARKALFINIKDLCQHLSGRILDIGCGSSPYKSLLQYTEYKGMEYDTPDNRKYKKADYFYDGVYFPMPDNSYDAVLCTQVLEHVFTPEIFIREISRVLKPDGKLLITVPFVWDEHEQPYDFARYSSFGLKSLLINSGFEIIGHRKLCNDVTVFFQLWNCYLYKKLKGHRNRLRLLIVNILTAVSNILGIFFNFFLPRNDDFYLDNIILAEKRKNTDSDIPTGE